MCCQKSSDAFLKPFLLSTPLLLASIVVSQISLKLLSYMYHSFYCAPVFSYAMEISCQSPSCVSFIFDFAKRNYNGTIILPYASSLIKSRSVTGFMILRWVLMSGFCNYYSDSIKQFVCQSKSKLLYR